MKSFLSLTRHLGVGLGLILLASAILLWSDPQRQQGKASQADLPKVAVVNYTSVSVLEEGEKGLIAGLAEAGFVDGRNVKLTHYNAEGDRPTAILIAKEVVGRDFDLILTISTPTLQAVANANTAPQRDHVFTLSTDPWGAGVGISREDHSIHPPYMTGYGSMQPVSGVFQLAREANPKLKRVGVAWNPAESNSEACTLMAREVCEELGIELVEVTVDTTTAVADAARSLVARNVEALWAGGDTTVATAMDSLVAAARTGRIPVFTNLPSDVKKGALFALGADYYEVGRASGLLAARVLNGESPASIPVENYVPEELAINELSLEGLKDDWTLPKNFRKESKIVVDKSGVHEARRQTAVSPVPGQMYRVGIVYFAPDDVADATIDGLKRKLTERGFVEGRNIEYRSAHAQGDISLIPAILQEFDQSAVDVIITLTTPCLTAASSVVKQKPVVFTEVYDPIAAGAGKTFDDHIEHVTGVGSFPPLEKTIAAMRQIVPDLKSVGVVFNNSEANSRKAVSVARDLLNAQSIRLETTTVTTISEVLQAAQVLTLRDVDALWEIGDNTVNQGLESLVKTGLDAGIPVFGNDVEGMNRGTLAGIGISFSESGYAAGDLVARVLLGESPARIPFEEVAEVRQGANFEIAKTLGKQFPVEFLKQCSWFHGIGTKLGRPARVSFVQLVEGPALDKATQGVLEGLTAGGLKTGEDVVIRQYNAQGDLSQLPQIFQNIISESPDLIITSTTPAMIAAARATQTVPIVFTVASEPSAVQVIPEGERQPNLVGVHDDPPIADLLRLAEKRQGTLRTVGTIWNPAEPNSEISVKRLRKVCEERGYKLLERHASSVSELRDVTSAICLAGIDILVISADNVTSSGFPAILAVTEPQHIPIYCTEPDLVRLGAEAAVGVDFYDWGRQTAVLASKVLAGVDPALLPMEKVRSIRTLTREEVLAEEEAKKAKPKSR